MHSALLLVETCRAAGLRNATLRDAVPACGLLRIRRTGFAACRRKPIAREPGADTDYEGYCQMRDETCRASVIIPVYNSAGTLRRAVNSVCAQTLTDIEVLLVDDGSEDDSLDVARQLAASDSRVRVIAQPTNRGKPHAMNVAIHQARGTWIAVLDADDWYQPDRLEIALAAGVACRVQLVADNQYFYDAAASRVVRTAFPTDQADLLLTKKVFIRRCDPYAGFNYGMLKPIVRADFIRRTGLAYREGARLGEDFFYLVEFFALGGVGCLLSRPLYNWTQSFGSFSRQWTTTGAGPWRYDFRSALATNAEVLTALRGRREPALVELLLLRAKAFETLHHINEIARKRSAGATLIEVAIAVLRHPSIWLVLLRRLPRLLARGLQRAGCVGAIPTPTPVDDRVVNTAK
jgi:succinoglycan biosynthesis protein ExoO